MTRFKCECLICTGYSMFGDADSEEDAAAQFSQVHLGPKHFDEGRKLVEWMMDIQQAVNDGDMTKKQARKEGNERFAQIVKTTWNPPDDPEAGRGSLPARSSTPGQVLPARTLPARSRRGGGRGR